MTLKQASLQALNVLEEMGDEWGFVSKRTLPERTETIIALRNALAEQTEKLKSVEESLLWAHNEINELIFSEWGYDPVDHEPIVKALKIIRSL